MNAPVQIDTLIEVLTEAHARTHEVIADLTDAQLMVPQAEILNPFNWEVGHVAFFWEYFVLRQLGRKPSIRADADALFDSAKVDHDTRWALPLPSRAEILAYTDTIRDLVIAHLKRQPLTSQNSYLPWLSVYHEDMHAEAFTYMRQTVGYAPPKLDVSTQPNVEAGALPGDAHVPGGEYRIGAEKGVPRFVFDNEQWAHEVSLPAFRIARAPVTQAEFAAFVDDRGYARRELWSDAGWDWLREADATHPVYWRRSVVGWQRRHFDAWHDLEPHRPVIHVNWFEAEAWCNWAGRRLPTEAEWEVAAAGPGKQLYPWGSEADGSRANLDWSRMDTVDVAALPEGDSVFGCRQMIGNVWEWTASPFAPYPGFVKGPYQEYSEPWFHERRVLRGGAWATRSRMIHNEWRNFFQPWRRDVMASFRTCAR
jgi:iron(II)-dependent oxidoreductase